MNYHAYCFRDTDGGVLLTVFFSGFSTQDDAEMFLHSLMAPLQTAHYHDDSETIH